MDLDATITKHRNRLDVIETFIADLKGKMTGAGDNVTRATDDLEALLAFKGEVEQALPMIHQAITDAKNIVGEFNAIVASFKPTFDWVQAQIAAEDTRKAARAAAVAAGEHVEEKAPTDAPLNDVDQPGAQTA